MSGKAKKSSLRQLRQKKQVDYRLMHTGKDAENKSSSSDETASEIEKSPLRASQMGDSTSAAPPVLPNIPPLWLQEDEKDYEEELTEISAEMSR